MERPTENLTCPFCDFVDEDEYFLMQHVELIHPENGESPFIAKEDSESNAPVGRSSLEKKEEAPSSIPPPPLPPRPNVHRYVDCPYGCGESVLSTEISEHTDFHMAEKMAFDEGGHSAQLELSTGPCNDQHAVRDISSSFSTDLPRSLRNYDQLQPSTPPSSKKRRSISLKELFLGSPTFAKDRKSFKPINDGKTRRLGRAELGPFAHERQMPGWLQRMLEEGAKVTVYNKIGLNGTVIKVEAIANETPDLIPVLARLSDLDRSVERAFYCSTEVRHIAKMPKEGGFCGYRNIQMLISYIRGAGATGHWEFPRKIPSILKLQDLIERAWDMGFNSSGKIETGGIRLTRKYIGTPEAQAVFLSLDIDCEACAFGRSEDLNARENLLFAVGEYFSNDKTPDLEEKVVLTNKPPIYFQHQGHSMTIVGLEARKDGSFNLVVFDPMFNPAPAMKKLVGSNSFRVQDPSRLLKAHRRGQGYLSKYAAFEILTLNGPLPGSMKEV